MDTLKVGVSSRSPIGWFTAVATADRLSDAVRGGVFAVLAAKVTSEPLVVGLISAAGFLPWLVVGPIAGLFLDRHSRVKTLRAVALVRALVALIAGACFALGMLTAASLGVIAVAITVLLVFSNTAQNSLLPDLVEEEGLTQVNARVSSFQSVAQIVGNPLGTSAASITSWFAFPFLAVVGLLQAWMTPRIPEPSPPENIANESSVEHSGIWRQLTAGVSSVLRSPKIRPLVGSVFVLNILSGVVMAVMPILALRSIGMNAVTLGLAYSVQAIAMVVGNLVSGRLAKPGRAEYLTMTFAIVGQAPGFVILAYSTVASNVIVGLALIGFCAGMWNVPSSSALMIASKGPSRSRILVAYKMLAVAGPPFGAVIGGAVASASSIQLTLLGASIIAMSTAVLFVISSQAHRRFSSDK